MNLKLIYLNESDNRWYNKFDKNKPLISPSRLLNYTNFIFEKIPEQHLKRPQELGKQLTELLEISKTHGIQKTKEIITDNELASIFVVLAEYIQKQEYTLVEFEKHIFSEKLEHYFHGFVDIVVKTKNGNYKNIEVKTYNKKKTIQKWLFQLSTYDYITQNSEPGEVIAIDRKTSELSTFSLSESEQQVNSEILNIINKIYKEL